MDGFEPDIKQEVVEDARNINAQDTAADMIPSTSDQLPTHIKEELEDGEYFSEPEVELESNGPDSDEEFVPDDDFVEDDDYDYSDGDSVKESKQRAKLTKEKIRVPRYLDDGDDKVFESRIKKYLAQEELDRIEEEEQQKEREKIKKDKENELEDGELGEVEKEKSPFKDIGGNLRMPRKIWEHLFEFQKKGVKWLAKLHNERVGGILADEMGLGKTVQVLSFLRAVAESPKNDEGHKFQALGPCLVICPASLIVQWVKSSHLYLPKARTVIFHGSGSHKGGVTSLMNKVTNNRKDGAFVVTPYATFNKSRKEFMKHKWHYVLLDEAHLIKNPDLQLTIAIKELHTPHRVLLTGTPMQNNLKELWSLVDCAYPGRLGALQPFLDNVALPITQGGYANASPVMKQSAIKCAQVLRSAIEPYLLRRTKAGVVDQLNLPEKNEQVLFCELTKWQRSLYIDFLQSRMCKRMMKGKVLPFSGLYTLRKLCNHPHLVTGGPKELAFGEDPSSVDAFGSPKLSGKLEVTRRLLSLWKEQQGSSKVLLFSQSRVMLDIVESMLLADGISYLRMDGNTPIAHRDGLVTKFNTDAKIFVFVLTTRVGGLGLNLTAANKVLIFDPCWNPSTDTQARERAWRIGQERRVTVYRLITSGTLEEKIYHRQLFKEFLAQRVLNGKAPKRLDLKTNDLHDLFSLSDLKKGGTDTGQLLADRSKERIGKNYFDSLAEKEEKHRKKDEKKDRKRDEKERKREEKEKQKRERELMEDEEDTNLDVPVLTEERRAELREMARRISQNLDLLPTKCAREDRPPDRALLFEGKYAIPYLLKHTKSKKEKKEEEKQEEGVMSILLKSRNVRSAINHDSVLGYEDKRKVEEKTKRAKQCIKLNGDEKALAQLRGSLPERGSRKEKEETKKGKKRKSEKGDDLVSAVRRRKQEDSQAMKNFLSSSRY